MPMLTISVKDSQRAFIDAAVASGRHASAEEFIGSLIQEAIDRCERIDALIQEGIDSGPAAEFTRQDWADIRRHLRERLDQRNGA